jgi:hypothetical protein
MDEIDEIEDFIDAKNDILKELIWLQDQISINEKYLERKKILEALLVLASSIEKDQQENNPLLYLKNALRKAEINEDYVLCADLKRKIDKLEV